MAKTADIKVRVSLTTLAKAATKLVSPNVILMVIQLLGLLAVLIGVGMWSIPSAFILGGLAIIVVMELQDRSEKQAEKSDREIKETIDRLLKEGKNPFDGTVPVSQKWISYAQIAAQRPQKG